MQQTIASTQPFASERPATSPEVRDIMRFRCGSLHENWYIAALAGEVTARKPLGRVIMQEPLVLFRSRKGQAVALIDRCLHRNAQLSQGALFDNCIGCPYHGWTYNTEGSCVYVPSEGAQPNSDRSLERFATREQDGFVWVYMGTPGRESEREPFRYPPINDGWASYTMVTRFQGDVTDLVENFMDVPHTVFVHKGWFRKPGKPKRAQATVERNEGAVLVEYFQPEDSIGFTKRILNPDGKVMTHTDRFFMPNCTRVDYAWGERRHFVITSQITPVTPTEAMVYTAITFRFGVFNHVARALLPWYTRIVINQDVRIMAIQTENLKRFGRRRFHGTAADTIHRYIEALREYALSGEAGPPPQPTRTRITFWM
jgi:phenylpropionate dioxygenase-like ring-hydroxylating dioxygenase large terminal subunit